MKLIVHYIGKHLGMFFAAIFFLSLETAADLLQPTFMSYIVDKGVKTKDMAAIAGYGGWMLLIAAAGALGAVLRNIFATRASQQIAKELRRDIYGKVQTLSYENIDRLKPSSIITRITNDVTQVQNFIAGIMRIMMKAPITCIGAIGLIIFQLPEMAPLMGVILLAAGCLIFGNMKMGYPRFGRMQQKLDQLNRVSREFLSAIRVVKAFRAEEEEEAKFQRSAEELSKAGVSSMRVLAIFGPLINLTVNLGIVVMLWFSGQQLEGEIGKLMACVNYMTQVLFSLGMVSNILNAAVRAAASAGRVKEILDEVPVQKEPEIKERALEGEVSFEKVSFTYQGTLRPALENVSFTVKKGETVGIIGPTGSGKSTLVSLVGRFYDAEKGMVKIDGEDVTNISTKSLRSFIGVVPQKALLFSGTILENLGWGDQDSTEEERKRAACIAMADEFIQKFPEKYETVLGQGGVNLSGGQKQRLSIARALLKKPRILILDDCTSALDAATEATVLEGIRKAAKGTTVFLVSQRISTVRRADHILCLEDGQLKGFGSHGELMETCGAYRAIYESQIGKEGAEK